MLNKTRMLLLMLKKWFQDVQSIPELRTEYSITKTINCCSPAKITPPAAKTARAHEGFQTACVGSLWERGTQKWVLSGWGPAAVIRTRARETSVAITGGNLRVLISAVMSRTRRGNFGRVWERPPEASELKVQRPLKPCKHIVSFLYNNHWWKRRFPERPGTWCSRQQWEKYRN